MRLIGSLTSPYVRFIRVVLAELGLDYHFDDTGPFGKQRPEQQAAINEANPLMKVPVLLVDEGSIIDSRVILEWLLDRHAGSNGFGAGFPESLLRENVLTTVYGVQEAGVLRFILQGSHPEIDMDRGYMARSLERMRHALDWLDRTRGLGESFGPPEAALVCCLEWLERRSVYDWSSQRRLVELHALHAGRPALVDTRIPETV
ncbi:MAG: glutathione S-transferase N-terminal domain-containing protein [Gammaproteobacteria bacterium]